MTEDIFTVEKIVDSRTSKGKKEYLIKWEGFDDKDNTWEAAKNILCKELIDEFEKNKKQKTSKKVKPSTISIEISNEWHDDVSHIESVYKDDASNSLKCDIIFTNNSKISVDNKQAHLKCPIKLLEYYEKNINFVDEQS